MRADRLMAIVLLLQSHGQLTAARLAELLETSERTVRRDLDALCLAGVPVYSQRGRGGGWALIDGHRLNLTGFTVDEARSLSLIAGAEGSGGRDVAPGLRSALRKILAALPEPLREHADAAQRATVIDPAGWGRTAAEKPPMLDELRAAVLARKQIDLTYAKPGGDPARRRVDPYGLVAKGGVWYLLAGTAAGRRTFRASRVHEVVTTDEPAVLPEGFDLPAAWASAERDFLQGLRAAEAEVEVEVEVAERAVLGLSASFGGWARLQEGGAARGPAGWRRFKIAVPHLRAAAAHLAPFGADVRVLAPHELRRELARIGRELLAANADPD